MSQLFIPTAKRFGYISAYEDLSLHFKRIDLARISMVGSDRGICMGLAIEGFSIFPFVIGSLLP